ncbi:MAG TPA: cytochrome P460 family protein [Candidatus Acidoferrales bacterium]
MDSKEISGGELLSDKAAKGKNMKRDVWFTVAAVCLSLSLLVAASRAKTQSSGSGKTDRPELNGNKELIRPENYRAWVFLSAGYGMTYSTGGNPQFTNVFVPQWAYREFMGSGRWPEQTMFVVEERSAQSKGSINKDGHFQTDLTGIAVEIKDARLPDTWGYFVFDESSKTAQMNSKGGCFSCHDAHAAVERTFVQFYPTLKPVAKKFGTYNQERENVEGATAAPSAPAKQQ